MTNSCIAPADHYRPRAGGLACLTRHLPGVRAFMVGFNANEPWIVDET